MNHLLRAIFFGVIVAITTVGCSGDEGDDLAEISASAIPPGEPQVIEGSLSFDEGCIRAGDATLVFVEGTASLNEESDLMALEVRWEDGGSGILSIAPFGVDGPAVTGFPIEPDGWVTEPPAGCDGPYFAVTGFGTPPKD